MTGHADVSSIAGDLAWTWEARSVNGRGLEIRVRLPEGFEVLEPAVRAALQAALTRGTVNVGLRIGRTAGVPGQRINVAALARVLEGARTAVAAAEDAGIPLTPMSVGEILATRGVLEAEVAAPLDDPATVDAITADLGALVRHLTAARADEGTALGRVLVGQIARIEELTATARETAEARAARSGALLTARVTALLSAGAPVDEARLAQELALLAVRVDVTEEIDRLNAHAASARQILAGASSVGRKLDFLTQEFNREVNTLCSKAQDPALTAVGLELKLVVDQLREQAQNLE